MTLERSLLLRPRRDAFARSSPMGSRQSDKRTIHLPVFRDFSGKLYHLAVSVKAGSRAGEAPARS